MNAQQRRKAYRKIDRMIGKTLNFISNRGHAVKVTVIGRTVPVCELASCAYDYNFDGERASVHRVRCRRNDRSDGWTFSPRLSQLRTA